MAPRICPCCGQEIPQQEGKRVCSQCGQAIKLRDKWHFGNDGRPRHWNCQQPKGAYSPAAETMELLK